MSTDNALLAALQVLVVDDDAIARRLATGILRSIAVGGYAEAVDGTSALTRLERAAPPIDVVIVDLEMEGMDGVEFLAELARSTPSVAVILASAMHRSVMAAVEEMAKNTGLRVLGALEKPLDRARVKGVLEALIANPERHVRPEREETFTDAEIHEAMLRNEFELYYQPKVDLRDGRLIGAEALVRWRHPERGIVPPMSFIPAAEKNGLINELTWTLFESGLRSAAQWSSTGLDIALSVNVTVGFLEELAVTENILALTHSHKVMPDRITLELTESMAATDVVPVVGNLARLRMRGFGLAIDDFGTGYSSMQQLSRIPFNELKVDRSFIEGAARQPEVRAILESSVELGRRLRLQTTAEGIETLDELAMLRGMGCDTAQGFLFARPMEIGAFRVWADDWNRGGHFPLQQAGPGGVATLS